MPANAPSNDTCIPVTEVPGLFQINEFPPSRVQELPFHLLKIIYSAMTAAYVVRSIVSDFSAAIGSVL
jgi:hypothetical protein